MAEREEELKSLLMKVEEESEQVGLKLNIQIIQFRTWGEQIPLVVVLALGEQSKI